MEFIRTGRSHAENIRYEVEYSPDIAPKKLDITIEVFPISEDREYRFEVEVPDTAEIKRFEERFEVRFDFNQLQDAWVEIKNICGENSQSPVKLEIPHPKIYEICETIINRNSFFEHEEWLKDYFSVTREGYHLIEFRAQAEKILTFRDHLDVLSFLADQHPRVGRVIAENSTGYFRNRVMRGTKPHSIVSFEDLKFKIDEFNDQYFLPSIDYNDILRECLDEICKRERNSGFDYAEHLFDRIYPENKSRPRYLNRLVCGLYISLLMAGYQHERANEFFTNWAEYAASPSGKNHSQLKELEEKSRSGDRISESEFGEYLYYLGRNQIEQNSRNETLPLFDVSTRLLDDSRKIASYAEFWARMREGERKRHKSPSEAREAFDEALIILKPTESDEEENWRRDALSRKYQAIVSDYETDSDADSAIKYLTHFVEDDLTDLEPDSDLRTQVNALRADLISKENIRNSAVELARENLEQALQLYSDADLHKSRAQMYSRLQLLEGFLDEVNGEFESASEAYQIASDIYEETLENQPLATRYADIALLLRAKSALINGEPQSAIEEIDEVVGETEELSTQKTALTNLAEYYNDYQSGDVSNEVTPYNSIKVDRVEGLVTAELNLNRALFVVYAAQYLRRYGFSIDILDSMTDIALRDSLTPNPQHQEFESREPIEPEERSLLMSISLDEVWQSKLPTHIHYQIEKLKIHEITHAGDYSGLVNELTRTLEVLLVVISEYYSRKGFDRIQNQIEPLNQATIGTLIDYVGGLPENLFPIAGELEQHFSEDILPDREISQIRNEGHHGGEIRYSSSEYERAREKLINIFRKVSTYCPIIVEIEDANALDMYLSIVHWGGLKSRLYIRSDANLQVGSLYYIPPGTVDDEYIVDLPEDSIYKCEARRAQNVRNVASTISEINRD